MVTGYRMTPEQWHGRKHQRPWDEPVSIEDCWRCQRNRAVCRSKRDYDTQEEAISAALEFNVLRGWDLPVVPYTCRYCEKLHLTKARRKNSQRRAEKQRRKWVIREHAEAHGVEALSVVDIGVAVGPVVVDDLDGASE